MSEAGALGVERPTGDPQRATAIYACAFLVFLVIPLVNAWEKGGWQRPVGVATVVVFCGWYVFGYVSEKVYWRDGAGLRQPWVWIWLAGLTILSGLIALTASEVAATGMSFVACGGAAMTSPRVGLAIVGASGAVAAVGVAQLGAGLWIVLAVGAWVVLIGMTVWGSVAVGRQRDSVVQARERQAEMAVELERTRLARDLHDILGHSLTVITVKAELAGRLVDVDPEKAKAELADLERLSRDALADIRTTVSDYRKLSLPGEIARAGRALAAANIRAVTPSAADDVRSELRDPFAWVVREGVTNVIRHSGATTCTIELTPTSVEVRDDGRAVTDEVLAGNGLTGLRERARQAGLRIVTERTNPHGFVLRAEEDV